MARQAGHCTILQRIPFERKNSQSEAYYSINGIAIAETLSPQLQMNECSVDRDCKSKAFLD